MLVVFEFWVFQQNHIDSDTITGVTALAAVENSNFTDSDTVVGVALLDTSTTSADLFDTGITIGLSNISAVDIFAGSDNNIAANTVTGVADISALESQETSDADTITGISTASAVEVVEYAESEALSGEAPTGIGTPSSIESTETVDTNIVTGAAVPSTVAGAETADYIDASGATSTPTGIAVISALEEINVLTTDADTITGVGNASSIEAADASDIATVTGTSSGDAVDIAAYLDGGTAPIIDTWVLSIVGTTTAGTFDLNIDNGVDPIETVIIDWNESFTSAELLIEALTFIGIGNVTVNGGPLPSSPLTIEFNGASSGTHFTLTTSSNTLNGGAVPALSNIIVGQTVIATGAASHSAVELCCVEDEDTITGAAVPSTVAGTETADYIDSEIVTGLAALSSAESIEGEDIDIVTGVASSISTDIADYADSNIVTGVPAFFSTDLLNMENADTIVGNGNSSAVDLFDGVDADTFAGISVVSALETAGYVDESIMVGAGGIDALEDVFGTPSVVTGKAVIIYDESHSGSPDETVCAPEIFDRRGRLLICLGRQTYFRIGSRI